MPYAPIPRTLVSWIWPASFSPSLGSGLHNPENLGESGGVGSILAHVGPASTRPARSKHGTHAWVESWKSERKKPGYDEDEAAKNTKEIYFERAEIANLEGVSCVKVRRDQQ